MAAAVGHQQMRDCEQVDGQVRREGPVVAAGLGDVPSVDGDLEGCDVGQDGIREPLICDIDDVGVTVLGAQRVEQPSDTLAKSPRRVGRRPVLDGRVQADASGVEALEECGDGLARVLEQHQQVPVPARCRTRQEFGCDSFDRAQCIAGRSFQ
jgi:hypothetical protein